MRGRALFGLLLVLAVALGTAGVVLATESSPPAKVCVPTKAGKPLVTPKSGACKNGYTLTEVGGHESSAGATGPTGPSGPPGYSGVTGATGPSGATGPTGPGCKEVGEECAGPTGPPGEQGSTGATGPEGREGTSGAGVETIAGYVMSDGSVGSGTHFTVAHLGTGRYEVRFPPGTWERRCPNLTVTPFGNSTVLVAVVANAFCPPNSGEAHMEVDLSETTGTVTPADGAFFFIAAEL